MKKSLTVIVPVLNEEETLLAVLKKITALAEVSQIIVVDDGSTDKTPHILKGFKNKKVKVITHKKNSGKGAALQTGLKHAKEDLVIFQDADLEYNPQEFLNLLKHAGKDQAVYGSRIKGNNPHAYWQTYLGNVLITGFCNALFGTNLTDSYTCYKLLPTKVAQGLKLKSRGFEVEAEITGKLAKSRIPIVEVPITYKPRSYEQGKKIKARDALKGAITYLKIRFW